MKSSPGWRTKGTTLRAFMREQPFAGRVPVMIGDDLTDVDAFRAAEELGGFAIAVGDRVSAQGVLPDHAGVIAWLAGLGTQSHRA